MQIIHLLNLIAIYSFFGWLLESTFKSINQKQFVNSGFLFGPVCPIYGIGALIMLLCLEGLKNKIILLFFVAFIVLSIWEYIVGFLLEKIFKTKYWDYSNYKFNIHGRVCLRNSIYWGILGVVFIKYIHPFVEKIIINVPNNIEIIACIAIYITFFIDSIISIITILKLSDAFERVNELKHKTKEALEELKLITANTSAKTRKENIEKVIHELTLKEQKLRIKIYKKVHRLKLAFPTMKSEIINQFLSPKMDLETLKKKIKKDN